MASLFKSLNKFIELIFNIHWIFQFSLDLTICGLWRPRHTPQWFGSYWLRACLCSWEYLVECGLSLPVISTLMNRNKYSASCVQLCESKRQIRCFIGFNLKIYSLVLISHSIFNHPRILFCPQNLGKNKKNSNTYWLFIPYSNNYPLSQIYLFTYLYSTTIG